MKFIKQFKAAGGKILAGSMAVAIAVLGAVPSFAGSYSLPLSITNWLAGTNTISGYPTNTFNPTNGFPMNNGTSVRVGDATEYALNVQGFWVTTNAVAGNVLSFMLVGSVAGNKPTVTLGTNVFSNGNTVMVGDDFQSTNVLLGPILVPLPLASTNWFNWSTNISSFANVSWLPSANWIGIYTISNIISGAGTLSPGANSFLSNATAQITYKLRPTPLIGQ